jgi:hypothetical protein
MTEGEMRAVVTMGAGIVLTAVLMLALAVFAGMPVPAP